ncbi:hypothetical protein IWQ61_000265 [Dispira simplex]|nr:hypothetical protein IWQ61_000265 [Dispira simplex]
MGSPYHKRSSGFGGFSRLRLLLLVFAILFLFHIIYSTLWQSSNTVQRSSLVKNNPVETIRPTFVSPTDETPEEDVRSSHTAAPGNNTITKVKGVFVVLVRNRELHDLRWSLRQLEDRFNHKHNYPYVFLNDKPFSEEFKRTISWITKAPVSFGLVPREHWSLPDWVDRYHMLEGMNDMVKNQVIYGASLSYRHMCRFNSGFFFQHPLLDGYEYYWRVEPDVQFTCDIDYDPFVYMKERDLKYGFTISLKEIPETVPTLWDTTRKFMSKYPEYVEQQNTLDWVTNDGGKTYNMCHFWSNFEIGKLDFFRSERYLKYFDFLDQEGGFFYERWGDAPVHSLAVAMFLRKEEVHWFRDIGYVHTVSQNCPSDPEMQKKCHCDPKKSVERTRHSCTLQWTQLPDNV